VATIKKPSTQKIPVNKPGIKISAITAKVKTYDETYKPRSKKASNNKENLLKSTNISEPKSHISFKPLASNLPEEEEEEERVFDSPDQEREEYLALMMDLDNLVDYQNGFCTLFIFYSSFFSQMKVSWTKSKA
jgi:hypothetical protein